MPVPPVGAAGAEAVAAPLPLQLVLTLPPLVAAPADARHLLAAAADLARLLQLPLQPLEAGGQPDQVLAALTAVAEGWLAGPLLDPGRCLGAGTSWAQALGAWRQPTLLLIPADLLDTGLPAAGTALLQRWRVPLLGLLQLGGAWCPQRRREEELPWLGHFGFAPTARTASLASEAGTAVSPLEQGEAEQELRARLRQAWMVTTRTCGWAEARQATA